MNKSENLILSETEIESISKSSGIDADIVRSWHKDFLTTCPKGKMVNWMLSFVFLFSDFIFKKG